MCSDPSVIAATARTAVSDSDTTVAVEMVHVRLDGVDYARLYALS